MTNWHSAVHAAHPADSVEVIVKTSSQAINAASTVTSTAVSKAAADVCNGGAAGGGRLAGVRFDRLHAVLCMLCFACCAPQPARPQQGVQSSTRISCAPHQERPALLLPMRAGNVQAAAQAAATATAKATATAVASAQVTVRTTGTASGCGTATASATAVRGLPASALSVHMCACWRDP